MILKPSIKTLKRNFLKLKNKISQVLHGKETSLFLEKFLKNKVLLKCFLKSLYLVEILKNIETQCILLVKNYELKEFPFWCFEQGNQEMTFLLFVQLFVMAKSTASELLYKCSKPLNLNPHLKIEFFNFLEFISVLVIYLCYAPLNHIQNIYFTHRINRRRAFFVFVHTLHMNFSLLTSQY